MKIYSNEIVFRGHPDKVCDQISDALLDEYLKTNATVRMSTYLYTTKEEIDAFVDAIKNGGDILDAYFN